MINSRKLKRKSEKSREPEGVGAGTAILLCLAVALTLTVIGILLAREIFALGERSVGAEPIEIELDSELDTGEVAGVLKENSLIGSKTLFRLYSRIRGKYRVFAPGKYIISPSAGYDGIILRLSGGESAKRRQVSVTVPEGSTVEDILRIVCDENGICSRESLINEINSGDFSEYGFVGDIPDNGRLYRLEGYLYPDTYYFYSDSSAYTVVDRMLQNFEQHFDERHLEACRKMKMTVDEAVTLASMIMKEAKSVSDYPLVSSVFHNRKNSRSFGGRFQSDATLTYALGRPMRGGDKDAPVPYNTYKYAGYPPSAICNPDISAISYALCPDRTSYYYFVSDRNGDMHYATTYSAHRRNVSKYLVSDSEDA
ncbi:MAG: endolytic transglycosylase MltG [Clostridia bacterium]|nr:endolytic transglycosylase MltG [Clostridia bacterium]